MPQSSRSPPHRHVAIPPKLNLRFFSLIYFSFLIHLRLFILVCPLIYLFNCVWSEAISEPKSSRSLPHRHVAIPPKLSLKFQNDCLAEMWSGFEKGSYLRLIYCCITQLEAREQYRRRRSPRARRPTARLLFRRSSTCGLFTYQFI